MAKRRILKKKIDYICNELIIDSYYALLSTGDINKEEFDAVINQIITMQDDALKKISHTEPGSEKLYYKKLIGDINAQIREIEDKIIKK